MKSVARQGDLHNCPIPGHGTTEIVSGSPSHVEGQPVARVGDKTGFGATIIQGSSHSHHDGRPHGVSWLQDGSWRRDYHRLE